jgi:hypothetical protein
MRVRLSDGKLVSVSNHAFERWQERVATTKDLEGASADLVRMLETLAVWADGDPPSWWMEDDEAADAFVLLGLDVVFPVRLARGAPIVVSCVARGSMSDASLARRAERRRGLATRRKVIRQENGKPRRNGAGARKNRRNDGVGGEGRRF